PANASELFNECHAELCNVVKCIIGVVKHQFCILVVLPEYGMDIQVHIPPACCCLHNIIRMWDPVELEDVEREINAKVYGSLADHVPTNADHEVMTLVWERIMQDMWASYAEE
ncbi:hypothetical protein PAXRUDRAFT_92290, partial [Paxillus rubicundulus Ve08.2h10]